MPGKAKGLGERGGYANAGEGAGTGAEEDSSKWQVVSCKFRTLTLPSPIHRRQGFGGQGWRGGMHFVRAEEFVDMGEGGTAFVVGDFYGTFNDLAGFWD